MCFTHPPQRNFLQKINHFLAGNPCFVLLFCFSAVWHPEDVQGLNWLQGHLSWFCCFGYLPAEKKKLFFLSFSFLWSLWVVRGAAKAEWVSLVNRQMHKDSPCPNRRHHKLQICWIHAESQTAESNEFNRHRGVPSMRSFMFFSISLGLQSVFCCSSGSHSAVWNTNSSNCALNWDGKRKGWRRATVWNSRGNV